jgi:hypothetical protein
LTRGGHRSRFSTFWIKNVFNLCFGGDGTRIRGGPERERLPRMRVMFFTWLTLITAGIVFYSVIGLSHH